jgi:hypothetical protein
MMKRCSAGMLTLSGRMPDSVRASGLASARLVTQASEKNFEPTSRGLHSLSLVQGIELVARSLGPLTHVGPRLRHAA